MFQVGDIVGLKICNVDRSNTAPSILPCKIFRIIKKEIFNTQYTIATLHGIITNSFLSSDFIDLSETISADLRQLDTTGLPMITFIQACQMFNNYKSINVCKCLDTCQTNRCPCRKQLVQCCSKCHRGQYGLYKNKT